MSSSPSPTTTSPMTAPLRNATVSPPFRDVLAAFAVLADAYVAVFMPKNPDRPENKPPVRNATGTHGFCRLNPYAITEKRITSPKKTSPTILYCCLR